jgi:quercetin dioxygenase-like cupin family protein
MIRDRVTEHIHRLLGMSQTPRRIVTGHDGAGRSVFLSDGPLPKTFDTGMAVFHEVWAASAVPVPINGDEPEPTERPVRIPPDAGGVIFRLIEMPPGAVAPMHRTETVDVGIVLDGDAWLILDDGSETRVNTGDTVVQRGTNHSWENRSDRVVRLAFVLIDGTISEAVRATTGPLECFDAVLD